MELTAERLYSQAQTKNSRSFIAWSISLCLHVGLISALILSIRPSSLLTNDDTQPTAIESYLVVAPKPALLRPKEITEQAPPDDAIRIEVLPKSHVTQPTSEPTEVSSIQPPSAPTESATESNSEVESADTPLFNESSTAKSNTEPSSLSSFSGNRALEAARNYIGQHNNDALDSLTQQAIQQYNDKQQHPVIETQPFQYLSEDEKFRNKITSQIDCRNILNKSIGILSGVTGGNLKCSQLPSLTPYIEKHTKQDRP